MVGLFVAERDGAQFLLSVAARCSAECVSIQKLGTEVTDASRKIRVPGGDSQILCAAVSANGHLLAVGCSDSRARLLSLSSRSVIASIMHGGPVQHIGFSQSDLLASCADDFITVRSVLSVYSEASKDQPVRMWARGVTPGSAPPPPPPPGLSPSPPASPPSASPAMSDDEGEEAQGHGEEREEGAEVAEGEEGDEGEAGGTLRRSMPENAQWRSDSEDGGGDEDEDEEDGENDEASVSDAGTSPPVSESGNRLTIVHEQSEARLVREMGSDKESDEAMSDPPESDAPESDTSNSTPVTFKILREMEAGARVVALSFEAGGDALLLLTAARCAKIPVGHVCLQSRCTVDCKVAHAPKGKKVFFEVVIEAIGDYAQFGWATPQFQPVSSSDGCGDDDQSWGVGIMDKEPYKFAQGDSVEWGGGLWRAGDTVGFAADLSSGKLWWATNGVWRPDDPEFTLSEEEYEQGLRPAFTTNDGAAVFAINFGVSPFRFPPSFDKFEPLAARASSAELHMFRGEAEAMLRAPAPAPDKVWIAAASRSLQVRNFALGRPVVPTSGGGGTNMWTSRAEHFMPITHIFSMDETVSAPVLHMLNMPQPVASWGGGVPHLSGGGAGACARFYQRWYTACYRWEVQPSCPQGD